MPCFRTRSINHDSTVDGLHIIRRGTDYHLPKDTTGSEKIQMKQRLVTNNGFLSLLYNRETYFIGIGRKQAKLSLVSNLR